MSIPLLIGSCEPFSGKSAVVLGLGRQLARAGVPLAFGKPLVTCMDDPLDNFPDAAPGHPLLDPDVRFIGDTLGLSQDQLIPSLHVMDPAAARERLLAGDLTPGEGLTLLQRRIHDDADRLVLLEGAGSLSEGQLYGLGLVQLAHALQAPVLLVHPWSDSRSVDALLEARRQLGDLLAGVVLNAVLPDMVPEVREAVQPALERLGIPVLGVMPRSPCCAASRWRSWPAASRPPCSAATTASTCWWRPSRSAP